MRLRAVPLLLMALFILAGCSTGPAQLLQQEAGDTLRLATTTSLDDSGLLDEILPDFEEQHDVDTEVIAGGTGQALELGERGDVDLVLVHAPSLEQEFVEQGYGVDRTTVMSNPFILVGPDVDPAGIADAEQAANALKRIANHEAPFVSRGDDSGTHLRELEIWEAAGHEPSSSKHWYHAAGQGMGETLLTANELNAYVMTDRATFITIDDTRVSNLTPLFGAPGLPGEGDPLLENHYSAIAVNPETHPEVRIDVARDFLTWFDSERTRDMITSYGLDEYEESLFTLIDEG